LYILQSKYKKGIYSLDTALFLHRLSDRTPIEYNMTFPVGYHAPSLENENIRISYVSKKWLDIGNITIETPLGHLVNAYNAERSICDLLKEKNHSDIQIIVETIKRYMNQKNRNVVLLSEYATLFRVEKKLRAFVEVLM
jgi:hypothetical protein